jgi:phage replication O-like protein O
MILMANPQPDQFTRISNELMEAIPMFKLNGTQLRILLVVLRYTYGFQRKSHELSLSFISNSTGAHKQQIKRELDILIQTKVLIEKSEPTFNRSRVIEFNKNYDEWLISRQSAKTLTVNKEDDTQSANTLTPTVSELAYQERNNKENIKESSSSINNPPPLMNDENLKRISKAYKDNGFGILFPNAGQALLELADEYTIEWVELAMEKAGKMGKRNVAYVEGILKGWEREGQPSVEIGGQKEVSQPHYFKPLEYEYED